MANKTLLNILRIRAVDAEEIWRTIRGAKVMIDKGTGEIKGGAGGKMNGMKYRPGFARNLKTGKRVLLPGLGTKVSHFKGTKADLLKRLGKAVEPPKKQTTVEDLRNTWDKVKKMGWSPYGKNPEERKKEVITALQDFIKMKNEADPVVAKKFRSRFSPEKRLQALLGNGVNKSATLASIAGKTAKVKTAADAAKFVKKNGYYEQPAVLPKNDKCAKIVVDGLATVFERYPVLKKEFGAFNVDPTMESNVFAHCVMYGYWNMRGKVEVNPLFFEDPAKLKADIDHCTKVKFHPANCDEKAIVVHEYGHSINRALNDAFGTSNEFGVYHKLEDHIFYNVCGLKNKTTKGEIENLVSGYAAKDHVEFFAEAFSEALCSSNPRPMSLKVLAEVDRLMGIYSMRHFARF